MNKEGGELIEVLNDVRNATIGTLMDPSDGHRFPNILNTIRAPLQRLCDRVKTLIAQFVSVRLFQGEGIETLEDWIIKQSNLLSILFYFFI